MTVRPATINFRMFPNCTFSEQVVLRGDNGVALDLTGASAHMQIRREIEDPTAIFNLLSTGSSPAIVLGGILGTIKFTISPNLMADVYVDWMGESWVHDLLVTLADGTTNRYFQGRVFAQPGVTRP